MCYKSLSSLICEKQPSSSWLPGCGMLSPGNCTCVMECASARAMGETLATQIFLRKRSRLRDCTALSWMVCVQEGGEGAEEV